MDILDMAEKMAHEEDWIGTATAAAVTGVMGSVDGAQRLDSLPMRLGRQLGIEFAAAEMSDDASAVLELCSGLMDVIPRLIGGRLRSLLPGLRRVAMIPHGTMYFSRLDEPEGAGVVFPSAALVEDAHGLADATTEINAGRLRFGADPDEALRNLLDYCETELERLNLALSILSQYETVASNGTGPIIFFSDAPQSRVLKLGDRSHENRGKPTLRVV